MSFFSIGFISGLQKERKKNSYFIWEEFLFTLRLSGSYVVIWKTHRMSTWLNSGNRSQARHHGRKKRIFNQHDVGKFLLYLFVFVKVRAKSF